MSAISKAESEAAKAPVLDADSDPEEMLGRTRLWLVHVINHRHLNDRGQYSNPGELDRYSFKNEAAARQRRDVLLEQFPYAFVYLGGTSVDDVERMSSPQWGDYSAERRDYLEWKSKSWFLRLFSGSPQLSVYDPDADPLSQFP